MPSAARVLLDFLNAGEHYSYGEHRCQRADLYAPLGDGPHPVVVVIHGGSWRAKYSKRVTRAICCDLVRRGFAAWNIEYRRVGRRQGGGFPSTFSDVSAAIDHLATLTASRLDLSNVVAVGHSAGGQLALWAAARPAAGVTIRRVAALAAPCDMAAAEIAWEFLGGTPQEVPERFDYADPMRLVPLGVPTLLVHGGEDETVPIIRSRRYAEAARAAGDDVELVEPVPGGHRVYLDPRSSAWRTAAEWIERG